MIANREQLSKLRFNEAGLIPAVVQSAQSNRVLMVAWMNLAAIEQTFAVGEPYSSQGHAPSYGTRERPLATPSVF